MSIFAKLISPFTSLANNVIDKAVTDKNLAQQLKANMAAAFAAEGMALIKAAASIINTEANGNWIQRSWRPLTMLTFVGLVVCKWMGWTDQSVTEAVELQLMEIIKIGLGGYVVGRTVEKGIKTWKEK